jgi:tRNA-modifying protein YgfZ
MDPNAYRALKENAAWIDLTGRGKIRVTGDDRVRLIHAMCTNQVQDLQPGLGCYAFFLTPQGRIIADANVFYMPDYLLLDTEPETKTRVLQHIDQYIIADDVLLHDFTDDWATVTVEGPGAAEVMEKLGASPGHIPLSLVEWGKAQVAHWSYTGGQGYAVYLPADEKLQLIANLTAAGVPQADAQTADAVRIANHRPRYGIEITEANIPQETGQMQAIHFSKGCYLGQEIVERVRSRGHVNRMLTPIRVEGQAAPEKGTKVLSGEKEVGEILSSAETPDGIAGFAVIRAEALGSPLTAAGATILPQSRG